MGLFTKKKKSKLLFCTNNIERFYSDDDLDIIDNLADDHNLNVAELECLSYCDECECGPYVLINNKFHQGSSTIEVIQFIENHIEKK